MKHDHTFFQNRECRYFPCHPEADAETFNCLFCYCPLYHFKDCGGESAMRGLVKDCTACLKPHAPGGYGHVQARLARFFAARRTARTSVPSDGPTESSGPKDSDEPAAVPCPEPTPQA